MAGEGERMREREVGGETKGDCTSSKISKQLCGKPRDIEWIQNEEQREIEGVKSAGLTIPLNHALAS